MHNTYSKLIQIILFCCTTGVVVPVCGQVTSNDYRRADSLFFHAPTVYNDAIRPHWIGDGHEFWYKNKERQGTVYYRTDASSGKKTRLFDPVRLAKVLSKLVQKEIQPYNLGLQREEVRKDSLLFRYGDKSYVYLISRNRLSEQIPGNPSGRPAENNAARGILSPDGKMDAYIKDCNLYLRTVADGKEYPLTTDGIKDLYYSADISWSPDSRKLVTLRTRQAPGRHIPLTSSSPKGQLQPSLKWIRYDKPGDVLPVSLPVLFDVKQRKAIPLDTRLYENPYSLRLTGWRADSRAFTFEYNQRGHQRYIVAEVNAQNGQITHLADERSKTFIYYNRLFRHDLNDGKEMLWISERDGWRHLYLLDNQGNVLRQLTKGEWVVREVVKVDEPGQTVYFKASGLYKGEDPYNIHYCKIRLDGSGFTDLTPENGNHEVSFSPDFQYMTDCYSRPDMPYKSLTRRTEDGKQTGDVQEADISGLKAEGWTMPEVFSAKGRDGKTDIWGTILRPSNFDPSRSYPVIEYIYAGPHDSHVPKSFIVRNFAGYRLCELGFIVVMIDGMGTANRSKAFHDVCWKNLKDAGFPDRIAWMKEAARRYPYMDLNRVGIFGWSAGGQNALSALLFHNDFYKVAVALCGCHDNRMDKMWWNEQWMGYPIDESYSRSSNVDNAWRLKGKLLLVNGELDDNVDPASTLQVVNALVNANKSFEQLYLPNRGHSLGGTYEMRRIHDFFVEHLYHQDVPEWE